MIQKTNSRIINNQKLISGKILNINANYKFIETFADWIFENYNSSFSELKIFLPNLRLVRNLKKYLNNSNQFISNQIKIKSILELDIKDFMDLLPNQYCNQIIDEISQIKLVPKLDAILWISEEIKKNPKFSHQNFTQRYKISKSIYDLFEEIDIQQIDPNSISLVDNFDMALHQQFTIEFFIEFYYEIKNKLQKLNSMFLQQYHNFLCDKYIDVLNNTTITQNIIFAGSTGSVFSSKKLIKAISNFERGCVVLYGLKYQENCQEIHPQYYLSQLIDFLEISPSLIENIQSQSHQIIDYPRQEFIELVFDDYRNYNLLKEKIYNFKNNYEQYLCNDIAIIDANSEFEEAHVIAEICKINQSLNQKIGIICNNQNLLQILKNTLITYNQNYNNSLSESVLKIDIINFLILIFENAFNQFNSYNFLAFIKHKYFVKLFNNSLIEEIEIELLRSDRRSNDINAIIDKTNNQKYLKFIHDILNNLPSKKTLNSIINSCEFFADDKFVNLLSNISAGKEIFEFLTIIEKHNFIIEKSDDLKVLFSDINYFEKSQVNSNIDILNSIEARLLNYDILIVCSLNDGDFPKIENHGWIGAKIKNELQINKSLKSVGQNAFDFCNYLANKKVYLTNSSTRLGAINVESQFLTRLKTLNKLSHINLNKNPQEFIFQNLNLSRKFYLPQPSPIVDVHNQPSSFSITEISKLISNPYQIFVKKILKIEELKSIDYEPANAEYGSFVHKALEEYVKNPDAINFETIFNQFFLSTQAKMVWYPKFEKLFKQFCIDNQQFIDCKNYLEESILINIANVQLRGKVDRIVIDNGQSIIIDYKTGQIPSKKNVLELLEPQLLVYALILSKVLLKNYPISELCYWKLNNYEGSKITKIFDNSTEINQAIIEINQKLHELFDYFVNQLNGYFATQNIEDDNIPNLSRINEWNN